MFLVPGGSKPSCGRPFEGETTPRWRGVAPISEQLLVFVTRPRKAISFLLLRKLFAHDPGFSTIEGGLAFSQTAPWRWRGATKNREKNAWRDPRVFRSARTSFGAAAAVTRCARWTRIS